MSSLIDDAVMLASREHAGQIDRNNQPYILHALRVALNQRTPQRIIAALLHDIIEDCHYKYDAIRMEFGDHIAIVVDLLTRPDGMSWNTYISRICGECYIDDAGNPVKITGGFTVAHEDACYIKLADMADNTRPGRMDHKAADRAKMYVDAYQRICAKLHIDSAFHA